MQVTIKTQDEIEKMRVAGRLAAEVLEMIEPHVQPGITTNELNDLCHQYIVEVQQAIPAPLHYGGSHDRPPYPKSICTSVNDVICHGIPNDKPLKAGDIVNIDVTVIKDAYHGDTSKMFCVGAVAPFANKLVRVTQECLYLGIQHVKPGVALKEIGILIQDHAHKNHFSVVREYCGHGIGRVFHEDPQVLHYYTPLEPHSKKAFDFILQEGMTFTIEPMINLGKRNVKPAASDGWTVKTKDRSLSAQWEHTILVTHDGYEVLTRRKEESI